MPTGADPLFPRPNCISQRWALPTTRPHSKPTHCGWKPDTWWEPVSVNAFSTEDALPSLPRPLPRICTTCPNSPLTGTSPPSPEPTGLCTHTSHSKHTAVQLLCWLLPSLHLPQALAHVEGEGENSGFPTILFLIPPLKVPSTRCYITRGFKTQRLNTQDGNRLLW